MARETLAQRADSGMAFVMATIFIALALLTVSAVGARYLQQRLEADAYQTYNKTFDAVETALATSKASLEDGGSGVIGLEGWTPQYNDKGELLLPDFDASASHPLSMPADPGAAPGRQPPQYIAYAVNWGNDGRDENGDGIADGTKEKFMYSIHAAAKYRNTVRRVESVYRATNVNVWQNAIFAGDGLAGGVIKGNVSIYGSVHILGNNLMQGGVALEDAIDLSGTSLIRNNYETLADYLRVRVPALPKTDVNGTAAETLDAKLRVKRGLVGMTGNSMIGEPYSDGSPAKQLLDGTYVTDGWSGKKTTPDGGRGIPSDVYSDNGWSALYDLGDKVPFPLLSDPWRFPDTGAKAFRSGTTTPFSHEEYFSEVLLASSTNPTDGVYAEDIKLDLTSRSAFYWNATTNTRLTGTAALAATPGANDDYLKFDPATATLKMNGQIRVNGSLSFSGQGNKDTLNYSGRCAFLAAENINIDVNLLSCNNGAPANIAASFPVNNCLGLMTKKDMLLGAGSGASQLDIMGAFYAQGKITSQKQTDVVGTFVSSFFDMTNQVPNIYQVPELPNNLPLGMIGNYPITALIRVSWRELGL